MTVIRPRMSVVKIRRHRVIIGLFAATLTLHSTSHALTFEKVDGQFILASTNSRECPDIMKEAEQFTKWFEYTEQRKCDTPPRLLSRAWFSYFECGVDLGRCVPNHIVKYYGVHPDVMGPNCFNLALVMSNLTPSLRLSKEDEIAYHLRSPLCRKITLDEKRRPGDIVLLSTKTDEGLLPWHTFIWISDKLAYSKPGYTNSTPYRVGPIEGEFQEFGSYEPECRLNSIDIIQKQNCSRKTEVFRCHSFEEFLRERSHLQSIAKMSDEIKKQEQDLETEIFRNSPRTISQESVKNIKDSLTVMQTGVERLIQEIDLDHDDERRFALTTLKLRIDSALQQLGSGWLWNSIDQDPRRQEYKTRDKARWINLFRKSFKELRVMGESANPILK